MSEGGQGAWSPIGQLSGQVIGGRYRLGEPLGQGGMGVVYTATQESLARPVALKVLQPMLAQDGASILRFKAEAERAGRLAHPHIVQILDFGHEPGTSAWIAMELLSGEALADRIERGPLTEAEVVRVAKETLSALEAAHAASLVHRDLKPDNIFLANVPGIGTSVKVLDFGIAKLLDDEGAGKLTATGMLIGTPLYMAPEQARGEDIDPRADLYALGVVLYEALTGRAPFTGKNYHALILSVLSETPEPVESLRPDVSPALARLVARAMAKDRAERYQSAREMAKALSAIPSESQTQSAGVARDAEFATARTVATPQPSAPLPTPAPEARDQRSRVDRRVGLGVVVVGGVLLTVTAIAVASVLSWNASEAPAAIAEHEPQPSGEQAPAAPPVATDSNAPKVGASHPPASPSGAEGSGPKPPNEDEQGLADSTETPGESARAERSTGSRTREPRTRRSTALPRPYVGYSGGTFAGLPSSSDLRGPIQAEGGWAQCWPRDVPAPDVNRGRDFEIHLAPDGRVLGARPTGNSAEPAAFASCVVPKLRRLRFAPTVTGEEARLRVSFIVEYR